MMTPAKGTPAMRGQRINCDYVWSPGRKTVDNLMLDLHDPRDSLGYLDALAKALAALRGITVEYSVLLAFQWNEATLASLGTDNAEGIEDAAALKYITALDNECKKVLVQQAIDGLISPRQPAVNFGEQGAVLEMPG